MVNSNLQKMDKTLMESPLPQILPEVQSLVLPEELLQIKEENQVIVHCSLLVIPGAMVRIWPTTYLVSNQGGERVQLAHAENITYAPRWTVLDRMGYYTFSLIFKGLPSSCITFDLVEEAKSPTGLNLEEWQLFKLTDIVRNETDVYQVWL
jgi:hypothetical protein